MDKVHIPLIAVFEPSQLVQNLVVQHYIQMIIVCVPVLTIGVRTGVDVVAVAAVVVVVLVFLAVAVCVVLIVVVAVLALVRIQSSLNDCVVSCGSKFVPYGFKCCHVCSRQTHYPK